MPLPPPSPPFPLQNFIKSILPRSSAWKSLNRRLKLEGRKMLLPHMNTALLRDCARLRINKACQWWFDPLQPVKCFAIQLQRCLRCFRYRGRAELDCSRLTAWNRYTTSVHCCYFAAVMKPLSPPRCHTHAEVVATKPNLRRPVISFIRGWCHEALRGEKKKVA